MTPEALVRSATRMATVPFVPEVTLATAAEPFGLWDASERDAPPFWAFPWAGGQGLARYVLDHPEVARGRRVFDVASGSGLVAIAAAKAGAAAVLAGDIDENSVAAIGLNAAANGAATVTAALFDLGDSADHADGADTVLAADVFYQRELASLALRFLRGAAQRGADVLVADPGRAFVPGHALDRVARYEVPVLTVLEDAPVKVVTVYRLPRSVPASLAERTPGRRGPPPEDRARPDGGFPAIGRTPGHRKVPGPGPPGSLAGPLVVLPDAAAQRRGQHLADRLDQP